MPLARQGWAGRVSDMCQMLHPELGCSSPGNTSWSKNHHVHSSCCRACHWSRRAVTCTNAHQIVSVQCDQLAAHI